MRIGKKLTGDSLASAILFLEIILLIPFVSSAQSSQQEILIGLIPEKNVFNQVEMYRPLAYYLSKKTGVKIKLTILSRYGNIIDTFTSQKMDGAFFGSFTGALAIAQLGAEPLARPVNSDGTSTYHGHIFVRKDSGIRNVADMKGKIMVFVDKATTAGYIFPMAYLKVQGVTDIKNYFKEYYFAGSHDAAIYAVLNKEADIGAAKNTIYDWLKEKDPRIDRELIILAECAAVPSNALLMRKTLDNNLKKKMKEILLSMDRDPEGRTVLEKMRTMKFIETKVDDYKPVFDLAEKGRFDCKRYYYRNE